MIEDSLWIWSLKQLPSWAIAGIMSALPMLPTGINSPLSLKARIILPIFFVIAFIVVGLVSELLRRGGHSVFTAIEKDQDSWWIWLAKSLAWLAIVAAVFGTAFVAGAFVSGIDLADLKGAFLIIVLCGICVVIAVDGVQRYMFHLRRKEARDRRPGFLTK